MRLSPPEKWSEFRVTDGARTRDIEDHNLALYQLSYGHHWEAVILPAAHGPINPSTNTHRRA
jgi:hypothetical protein